MRTAVLASGSGTILDAMADGGVPIDLVVVDRACGATDVADRHGLTWELVERTDFSKSFDYTQTPTEPFVFHPIAVPRASIAYIEAHPPADDDT